MGIVILVHPHLFFKIYLPCLTTEMKAGCLLRGTTFLMRSTKLLTNQTNLLSAVINQPHLCLCITDQRQPRQHPQSHRLQAERQG